MKTLLRLLLLATAAELTQASIIETITFNLSPLHAGSTLSGTFTLSDTPMAGDTAPVLLSFSDPSDYMPTSLMSTISILSGTPSGYAVDFSSLAFTNLSGAVTPINTRDVSLMRLAFAVCTSFPCTATGLFQDRSPAVFTSNYAIAPVVIPEPAYAFVIPVLLAAIIFGRRLGRAIRIN